MGEHKSFILVEDVSDHLPVMVCSNLSLPKSEKSTVTLIRDTKNFEVKKFLDKLTEGMELLGDIKEECIDNYTEKFIDIFHETLNIHAPLRKQSRKETKLKNKPWLSKGNLISIQLKIILSIHLQYCISSWGTAAKSTLGPLFILQKRSIRLLTGSGYREHTNPLFYRAKCLKLKDIYSLETAKLMYKIHNNVLSFANSDKFNLIKNCYTHKTRLSHKNNFFLPRTRTRLGQKSLSFAGIKVWNEIPSSMKEVSFYRFKKAVKAHFLSNYETDKC